MGQQAAEMKTAANILGITTDQFQALKEAGEAAGVGQETLTRAGEKLVSMLTEARNGSGEAIDKLRTLGLTTEQLADPTFKLNDLFELLHERLVNVDTEADTMNSLLLVLGNRSAAAAEALKHYDGSAEGVAEVMRAINGITTEQNQVLIEQGERWNEFATKSENAIKKAMVALVDYSAHLRETVPILKMVADAVGAPTLAPQSSSGSSLFSSEIKDAQAAAAAMLTTQEKAATEGLKITLENQRELVGAYREGSAQRLSALQEEYQTALKYYGGPDVDKVRAIYQQLMQAQRAYYDTQLRESQEATAAEDRHVAGVLRGFANQIEANQRYFDEAEQNQKKLDQITEYSEDLQTRLMKERSGLLQQQRALEQRVANEWYQKWSGVSGAIQSSFSGAISGMLQGTMTFAGALQSIMSSVIDSLIQMFVKMGVQWAEGLLYQQVAQKATAISSVTANSGIAATAAMASVAAIPFYGWAMAPEVGAATFAEGMAYLASASASGGFDIPAGQNPITQLHAREMVLPASLADPIRDMASGGSRGGTVHIHGKSDDKVTVDQLVAMMKSAGHRFKFV
jgi:hypothetical protein